MAKTKRRLYFCVVKHHQGRVQSYYGCSTNHAEVERAHGRAKARGMTNLAIIVRSSAPHGLKPNVWLQPTHKR